MLFELNDITVMILFPHTYYCHLHNSAYELQYSSYFKVLYSWTAVDRLGHLFRLDKYMFLHLILLRLFIDYYYSFMIYICFFILNLLSKLVAHPYYIMNKITEMYETKEIRERTKFEKSLTDLSEVSYSLINPFWGK